MTNSIKRSDVNRIMRESDKFIRSFGYIMPPFAYWSPAEFKARKTEASWIVDHHMGWDITDYGLGDFSETGRRHLGRLLAAVEIQLGHRGGQFHAGQRP